MNVDDATDETLYRLLDRRFGDFAPLHPAPAGIDRLIPFAEHRTTRDFSPRPVESELVRALCAASLCAPAKSDLQQRDIVLVQDRALRQRLNAMLNQFAWLPSAPVLLVICGNNRRQRQIHQWRGRNFANDHLDAFFNAATDAAIALAWLVAAADAVGLGSCPISAIRDDAQGVSDLLALPDHVFPFAGLALGWPATPGTLSPRLPLAATCHVDRFDDTAITDHVESYDRRRAAQKPFGKQRLVEEYGTTENYSWSEDVARQYSKPARANFGDFIRRKGFILD